MRTCSRTLAPILLLATTTLCAEQLYVEDKLVLNVYAEADQGSARIATIETGDAVEAFERIDNFVRVQLADGREGWVGASYLSAQPPAIVRLEQLQAASGANASEPPKQLTDEIARLKKQNTTLQTEVTELKKKLNAPVSTLGRSPNAASAGAQERPSAGASTGDSPRGTSGGRRWSQERPPPLNAVAAPAAHVETEPAALPPAEPTVVIERSYWWAWVLAVIAAGGGGFAAGYQTLGRRVRERFGGVKVY